MNLSETNNVSGASSQMAPLISFNTIFDLDYGLAKLIEKEYLNPKVFNVDYFKKSRISIIKDLYYREHENILYLFAKDNISKALLDEYYNEFLNTCQDKIIDNCISTEIINLISLFNTNKEIRTSVLYYTDKQKEVLDDEPELKNVTKVCLSDLNIKSRVSYSQYYVRSIEELKPFLHAEAKTFYLSNRRLNLNNEQDDLLDHEYIAQILAGMNHINIFNMYNEAVLKGEKG